MTARATQEGQFYRQCETGYTCQMSPLLVLKLTLQSLRNDFPSLQVLVQVLEAVLLPVSKQKKEIKLC